MGTRLVQELAEFSGDLSLEGLHFWKTAFSAMTNPAGISCLSQAAPASKTSDHHAELDPSSAKNKKIALLPCKTPPSRQRVQLWLEARKQYESLQKERRNVEEGNPERSEQPAASSCPAVKVEQDGDKSSIRTQRRKKLNLSLIISPLVKTGSKSPEVSPVSDESSAALVHRDHDADDAESTSPDSPELPPWQQSHQPSSSDPDRLSDKPRENSPEPVSPSISGSQERLGGDYSPSAFCGGDKEEDRILHSTPFLRKRRRCKEDLELVCSTPMAEGRRKRLLFCTCASTEGYVVSFTFFMFGWYVLVLHLKCLS